MKRRPSFANDPLLGLEFMLAERLCRTVAELRASMDVPELVQWLAFRRYQDAVRQKVEKQAEMQREMAQRR